jgi:hypothetical protein
MITPHFSKPANVYLNIPNQRTWVANGSRSATRVYQPTAALLAVSPFNIYGRQSWIAYKQLTLEKQKSRNDIRFGF